MRDMTYILYSHWLKVPDFLYLILLFGGWISLIFSAGMIIQGIVQKKEKTIFRNWCIVLLIALVLIVLTMTGKIAPDMSFGG